MSSDPFSEPDVFEQWLQTGTIRRVLVTLYNDPTLEAEVDELEQLRKDIESRPSQRTLDEPNRSAELERREEDLANRIAASRSVWSIKALLDEEFDAAVALHPELPAPTLPPPGASNEAKAQWARDRDAWKDAEAEKELERRLYLISHAVESVETANGSTDHVTVDALRKMLAVEYGRWRIGQLWAAVIDAREGEVRVPAPK